MKLNRFWLGIGVIGVATLFFIKRRKRATPIEFNSLDPKMAIDDGSEIVELQGLHVRTRVGGTGSPAVVLLHGFAASVFTWHNVFEPLSELGTLVAFDRPSCGFTTRPLRQEWEGHNPYSLASQADLTIALLDELGIERAILIGHSAGGAVATLAALNHPDRVQSLVLVAPAVYFVVPSPNWVRLLLDSSLMQYVGPHIARIGARLANLILNRAWHDPSRITPDIRDGYFTPLRTKNWDKAMWEVVRADPPEGLRDRVRSIQTKTLVVSGDDDRIVPVTLARRLASELPNAVLNVIPDCGHIPQEEQPQAFLDVVVPFIESESSTPTT